MGNLETLIFVWSNFSGSGGFCGENGQTSEIKRFDKLVKGFKQFTVFAESSVIIDMFLKTPSNMPYQLMYFKYIFY